MKMRLFFLLLAGFGMTWLAVGRRTYSQVRVNAEYPERRQVVRGNVNQGWIDTDIVPFNLPTTPLTDTASLYLPVVIKGLDLVTFTHGIASGDVDQTSAWLWTRANLPAKLTVEVSTEPTFAQPTFEGQLVVGPSTDFTAEVLAEPLSPGETYYYRWRHVYATSPIGMFRTPADLSVGTDVRFAYTGDSDVYFVNSDPQTYSFDTFASAQAEGLDFFVYLGDIIYADSALRPGGAAATLDDYRGVYRISREIQALPDLLKATSVYAIWDDHEVENDFSGQTVDPTLFAYGRQSLLEYFPLADSNLPSDPSCAADPLFRTFRWGKDVDVVILDERSCRSGDVLDMCLLFGTIPDPVPTAPSSLRALFGLNPSPVPGCLEAINDPSRTFLGPVQKQLFKDFLLSSTAKFKFVINDLPIQQFYALPYDRWEGYAAERTEILNFIRDNNIENVIFLTTDAHANLTNEVFLDHETDPTPIAYDLVTGPVATYTMEEQIENLLGQDGLNAFNDLLTIVGVDCRHLDAYSYGMVVVDASAGTATVTLKDEQGVVLNDQLNPGVQCERTFGP